MPNDTMQRDGIYCFGAECSILKKRGQPEFLKERSFSGQDILHGRNFVVGV